MPNLPARLLTVVAVVAAAALIPFGASAAAPKAAVKAKASAAKAPAPKPTPFRIRYGPAPADEYFGRLGLSILGVRNKVKDLGLQIAVHPDQSLAVLSNARYVEDAMRAWARKYPYDKWLPRYAYALETMYETIPGDEARARTLRQLNYITAYFPQTEYGRVGRAKIVAGVPRPDPSATPDGELQRLALLDGRVRPTLPPLAAPSPSPSASPAPSALPAASASPAPSGSPRPLSAPSATPAPQRSPS